MISDRILNQLKINEDKFKLVGYLELSKEKYYVNYENNCELVDDKEISIKVINLFNNTGGCTKPQENQFEPNFSNCNATIFRNEKGNSSVIQIWYNKK